MFLVYFLSLFFFLGCGDPEDTDSIVIPDELYDTSEFTYDISDAEIQELMEETDDPELFANIYVLLLARPRDLRLLLCFRHRFQHSKGLISSPLLFLC